MDLKYDLNFEDVVNGDFSALLNYDQPWELLALMKNLEDGYEVLGSELVKECLNNPEKIHNMIDMFVLYLIKIDAKKTHSNDFYNFISALRTIDLDWQTLKELKTGYELLGIELVEKCYSDSPYITEVIEMFSSFSSVIDNKNKFNELIDNFSERRLNANINLLYKAVQTKQFALNESEKKIWQFLVENFDFTNETITFEKIINYFNSRIQYSDADIETILSILSWFHYEFSQEKDLFYEEILKDKQRDRVVLSSRANNLTLKEIGLKLGVTRERVRQIEMKIKWRFQRLLYRIGVLYKFLADFGHVSLIDSRTIAQNIGEFGNEFVYLLKFIKSPVFYYNDLLDSFILVSKETVNSIGTHISKLSRIVSFKERCEFIDQTSLCFSCQPELVERLFDTEFKKSGEFYHRGRLTVGDIISILIKQYYPDGIHIYDPDEYANLRKLAKKVFDFELKDNINSVANALTANSILCDRGTYCVMDELPIEPALIEEIEAYIESSKAPLISFHTLYSEFEDELVASGVHNRYFLQGILKELFDSRWYFRKNYIAKENQGMTYHDLLIKYVAKSTVPVDKDELIRAFPGITQAMISFNFDQPEILNLFGSYLHVNHLKLSDRDIDYLRQVIDLFLQDDQFCSCNKIIEYIKTVNPYLLSRNFINFGSDLYSLFKYLFAEEFYFFRPFVMRQAIEVDRASDFLHKIVTDSDTISVAKIKHLADDYHIVIQDMLDFINSCNNTHLLVNDKFLMSIADTGVTAAVANELDRLLTKQVSQTMPIASLILPADLPQINIQWHEWLIYSTLKKWPGNLEVEQSNSWFKYSFPLISPKGQMDRKPFIDVNPREIGDLILGTENDIFDNLIKNIDFEDLEEFI